MPESSLIITKLLQIPRVGSRTALKIYNTLLSMSFPFGNDYNMADVVRTILRGRCSKDAIIKSFEEGEVLYSRSLNTGIRFLSVYDDGYPANLKRLKTPPALIHYKGNITIFKNRTTAAVVGTRTPTKHGYALAMRLGSLFAENNFVVVGGLAAGCGTAGHLGCLRSKGLTAAVVGHGLRYFYPKENKTLAENIIDNGGVLMSEYFSDEPPSPGYFVARNRIQAGLSEFIFVVEAGSKSGTRHTVQAALQCNIPVYAYDHPEKYRNEETSKGNQMLIKEGKAIPVKDKRDIDDLVGRHHQSVLDAG